LAASGVSPEVLAQAVMFQKALAASGASPGVALLDNPSFFVAREERR